MKRTRGLFVSAAVFLIMSAGCSEKIEPGHTAPPSGPAVKAAVATARAGTWPLVFEAVGTVQAETASTVAAKLMGTITSVRVREGDRVRQGDVLVTIDERQVGAQRQQAEAALSEARRVEEGARSAREAAAAGAELAAATYRRYQAMLSHESVSRQEFDEVDARQRQARAALAQSEDMQKAAGQRVRQAEAALAAASVSAGDATVRAVFDGIVAAKMVDPGDLAVPGKPLLSLEKTGGHRVDIQVPEAYVRSVHSGQAVSVRVEGPAPFSREGVVDVVAPAADSSSRSFLVKVRLPAGSEVRSGMFARVALAVGEDRLTAIPVSALIQEGQLTGVYLVATDGSARFRLIRTGRRLGDQVEVISGLPEGSRFVVSPPPGLVDGGRVEAPS
jgi:multidrug efflux pump subunit AcrA (membrane-fusion protein)